MYRLDMHDFKAYHHSSRNQSLTSTTWPSNHWGRSCRCETFRNLQLWRQIFGQLFNQSLHLYNDQLQQAFPKKECFHVFPNFFVHWFSLDLNLELGTWAWILQSTLVEGTTFSVFFQNVQNGAKCTQASSYHVVNRLKLANVWSMWDCLCPTPTFLKMWTKGWGWNETLWDPILWTSQASGLLKCGCS